MCTNQNDLSVWPGCLAVVGWESIGCFDGVQVESSTVQHETALVHGHVSLEEGMAPATDIECSELHRQHVAAW